MTRPPAREVNVWNLKGNGMSMAAEGEAMAEHGREMTAQVEQLREDGALSPELADQLLAAGQELIATGEASNGMASAWRSSPISC